MGRYYGVGRGASNRWDGDPRHTLCDGVPLTLAALPAVDS